MKRRILLFMMTALLSVGAWAQSLQTKTLFEGPKTVTSSDKLTIEKSELQGARIGSQICIYMDLSVSGDQWGDNIIYYNGWNGQSVYRSVSVNPGTGIVVKVLLDADVIDCSSDFTIYPQNDYSTCTVTKVTLNYNGANLLTNAEGWDPGWYGTQLKCSNASEGDVLAVAIKANSITYGWGTANGKLYLQSATGNPEATDPAGRPTGYCYYEGFSENATLYIPLTSELASYAQANSLYIGGWGYTVTSVDLIYQPSAVNIGSAGYATFGYPFAVDLSGLGVGQDAYTVTVSGTTATLTSVKGMKIPANTGIILTGSGNVTIPLTTEATEEITGNQLLVSDGTKTGDGSSIYVLANGTNGVGFYKLANEQTIAAGKAYLKVTPPSASSFFDIDDGTTGITMVQGEGFMVNGSDIYYDLQGRRVAKPTKGLYIVNGKKVIIK